MKNLLNLLTSKGLLKIQRPLLRIRVKKLSKFFSEGPLNALDFGS